MVQKLHLLGRRLDALAVDHQLERIQVNDQLVEDQTARLFLAVFSFSGAAQDRLNAREHLLHLEGLGDIVVRALLEPRDLVDGLALGSEHDDGRLAVLPDGAQHAPAVQNRQHQVQQHQIGLEPSVKLHALSAVVGNVDGVAFLFQIHLDQFGDIGVVFHDEDRFCHKTLSLLCYLNYYTAVVGICVNIL